MLKNILNLEGAQKLTTSEQKDIMGGRRAQGELQSWKCCDAGGHCGDCASSSGIPTCSSGYTVTSC